MLFILFTSYVTSPKLIGETDASDGAFASSVLEL